MSRSPNVIRLDVAVAAIYRCAPLGELAHGYLWEDCMARATPRQRLTYWATAHAVHSDRRDANIMHALTRTPRDYQGRVQDMATCGMSAAESRMCYFGDAS